MYEDDIFVEEMVVRRKTVWNLLLSVLVVIVALFLAVFLWLLVPALTPAMLVIVCLAAYLGIKFQYVEYEYSFTNGDLDVDKIMAKRKRKRALEINQKQIQIMAPYTAEYESEVKGYQVAQVLDLSSSKNAAGRWFLIYERREGGYGFAVLQPSKRLREAMQKYLHSRMKGMD